ncbi:MAG: hypothetical protein GX910_00990 [Clostridiaceae bacterium]|jgi:ATP-dependent helicase/nuclease subunit B|nr:hypothetical protein [Clostridiaceae bacterium]
MTHAAITILYSTDHHALEARVFDEMTRMTHLWPDRRGFLIVPERMKADTERHYLESAKANGLMMAEILSFNRFATRLFSESGTNAQKVISKAGKAVIAQKSLLDRDLPFRRFHRLAGRPRYAAELVRVLGDFQRYGIDTCDLYRAAGNDTANADAATSATTEEPASVGSDLTPADRTTVITDAAEATIFSGAGATRDKCFDFALLKETMDDEFLRRNLLDPDTTLPRLAALLNQRPHPPALSFLENSALWILGFGTTRNFTSQEFDVLRALAASVGQLTITVMADDQQKGGELAFRHGRDTLNTLTLQFPNARPVRVPFKEKRSPAIRLVRAVNTQEETRFAAAEIRSLLLGYERIGYTNGKEANVGASCPECGHTEGASSSHEKPLRRRDIAIALSGDPGLAEKLHQALLDYGIDAYLDIRKPLIQSSFLRSFIAFLRLTAYDFTMNDLMAYYRCGLSPIDERTIDLFENAALAAGWRTSRDFRKIVSLDHEKICHVFAKSGIAPSDWESVATALHHIRQLLEKTSAMRQARSGSAKCAFLLDHLFSTSESLDVNNDLAERVAERRDTLLQYGREDSAILLVSSWNATVDFLVEASEILGNTRISQESFTRMMEAGISGLELSSIPTGADRIRVGTLEQIANWPCRVLYILGATASSFPPDAGQEGYLRDDERDWLSSFLGKTFPNRKASLPAEQAWLVRSLLSTAKDSVSLFSPTLGDDVSSVFNELESLAEAQLVVSEPDEHPDIRWNALIPATRLLRRNRTVLPFWRLTIEKSIAAQVQGHGEPFDRDATASFSEDENRPDAMPKTLQERVISLPPSFILNAMTNRRGISISLLQSFNQCPFAFFINTVLGAKERTIAEDAPNLQGELLHRMVDLAASDLVKALARAVNTDEAEKVANSWRNALQQTYPRELYDRAAKTPGFGWYRQSDLAAGIGERIALHAAETLLVMDTFNQASGYLPKALEVYFPQSDKNPLTITSDGQSFVLRGLIDRVDANPAGNIRLFDYKRTGKPFSWSGLYDGTDLQLPLYKAAFEKEWPDTHVRELYFAGFTTPVSKTPSEFTNRRDEAFEESVKQLESQKKVWDEGDSADRVARYAKKRATRTMDDILKGNFAARPALRGSNNPCSYCEWRASCGFDSRYASGSPLLSSAAENKRLRELILNDE